MALKTAIFRLPSVPWPETRVRLERGANSILRISDCAFSHTVFASANFFFFLVRRYSGNFASPRVRKSLAGPMFVGGGGAILSEFRLGGGTESSAGEALFVVLTTVGSSFVGRMERGSQSRKSAASRILTPAATREQTVFCLSSSRTLGRPTVACGIAVGWRSRCGLRITDCGLRLQVSCSVNAHLEFGIAEVVAQFPGKNCAGALRPPAGNWVAKNRRAYS